MRVANVKGVQSQRRQGKVVNKLRLVGSIPKIGNVIDVRHIGFSNEVNIWCNFVQGGAQELNNAMRLRQVNAVCADFLPHVGDRIQTNECCAALDIQQQDIKNFEQYFGVLVIQIDLVG